MVLLWVVVSLLIGLCEGVVVGLTSLVVSVTSEILLLLLGFLNFNSHSFDLNTQLRRRVVTYLVVLHSDFDFEVVLHHVLLGVDGVEVVLLLVLSWVTVLLLHFHLLLHLELLLHLHLGWVHAVRVHAHLHLRLHFLLLLLLQLLLLVLIHLILIHHRLFWHGLLSLHLVVHLLVASHRLLLWGHLWLLLIHLNSKSKFLFYL